MISPAGTAENVPGCNPGGTSTSKTYESALRPGLRSSRPYGAPYQAGRPGSPDPSANAIPLPPGHEQEQTDPATEHRNNVQHVSPTLGFEGLHQEDIEPGRHGDQCRQGIQPHAKGTRSAGWRFLSSSSPMIWPTNMIRIRARSRAVMICTRSNKLAMVDTTPTSTRDRCGKSLGRVGLREEAEECAVERRREGNARIAQHQGVDRGKGRNHHHDRQPLPRP